MQLKRFRPPEYRKRVKHSAVLLNVSDGSLVRALDKMSRVIMMLSYKAVKYLISSPHSGRVRIWTSVLSGEAVKSHRSAAESLWAVDYCGVLIEVTTPISESI